MGNLLDLDWYIETTSKEMPLNMPKALRRFDSGREFYMVASRPTILRQIIFNQKKHMA